MGTVLGFTAVARPRLPAEMHDLAMVSITNAYRENFKEAAGAARKMIKHDPSRPAGYFFYAAVLNSQMEYLQSEEFEEEFYRYCDEAIDRGERMLEEDPNDLWARFFAAGANGCKGTYESRKGLWITAFKHGWRGVSGLKVAQEKAPELMDASYGVGVYDYWRSAKTKLLWWLPGVKDGRDSAVVMLRRARKEGTYTREAAALSLVDILCDYERYSEALEVVDEYLAEYPSSLLAHWGKVRALVGLEKYGMAEKSCTYIRHRIETERFESNHNLAMCQYYLCKIYFGQQKYDECIRMQKELASLPLSDKIRKRLEGVVNEAGGIARKARNRRARSRD